MSPEKLAITNRKGQKIVVLLEQSSAQNGLVFIEHGLTGFKEQPHIQLYAQTFLEKDYTVIRFDTTNSLGESDGDPGDATVTSYLHDLEDVLVWARTKLWYQEPFILAGHSLGSMAITLYAENHPQNVRALAPLSTVVSGKKSLEKHGGQYLQEWKERGYIVKESQAKPGSITRIKWAHAEDRSRYNLLEKAGQLTMPVLLVVGSNDESTPLAHQQELYAALPGRKELHVIQGSGHTFRKPEHLNQVRQVLAQWIDAL